MCAAASGSRRSHLFGSAAAVLGAALMLAPPPAAADRDWDDDGRRGHHSRSHRHDKHDWRHHSGDHHRHGDWCPPRYARPYAPRYVVRPPVYAYGYGPGWYAPPLRRSRYYCEPCDHWYTTRVTFHRHVHHHHGIAEALLPAVIVATVFGAIFAGY
jgi:hypothetical protein